MADSHEGRDRAGGSQRRGLFRRSRRAEAPQPDIDETTTGTAVTIETIDELARRMEQLVAESGVVDAGTSSAPTVADDPVRAEFEMQRAVIARANDLAAAAHPTVDDRGDAMEVPVAMKEENEAPMTDITHDGDVEARLEAALNPIEQTVTLDPAPELAAELEFTPVQPAGETVSEPAPIEAPQPQPQPAVMQDAILAPTTADVHAEAGAALQLGIDVNRVVQAIEDEALSVQRRIELEVSHAHIRAEEIVDRAEAEAERIREHGQAQARVLLSEVEEIISEAQQTGEQILHRANEEAATMRGEATNVLHQAQSEARQVVDTARREGEQVLAEQRRLATVRAQEAMREQERLKDQIRRLEERRRQVLESLEPLISQLTQMMPAGVATPDASAPQNVVHLQQPTAQQG